MVLLVSEAGIISTCIQGFLQGLAVLMFTLTIFILTRESRHYPLNRSMLIASSALIVLSTAEFISNIVRLVRGFITVGPNLPGGVEGFFASIPESTLLVKSVLHPIQVLILDGVVIYRAYVAWQSSLSLVVPGIGWCSVLASSIGKCYALFTFRRHSQSVYAPQTGSWVAAVYVTSLITNITATFLLAFRLWKVNRSIEGLGSSPKLRVVYQVVIESGAIYTAFSMTTLFLFLTHNPMVYIFRDFIPPIISIVFNMIVVRVGLATSRTLTVLGIESSRVTSKSALKFGGITSQSMVSSFTGEVATFTGTPSMYPDKQRRNPVTVELMQFLGSDNTFASRNEHENKAIAGVPIPLGDTGDTHVA